MADLTKVNKRKQKAFKSVRPASGPSFGAAFKITDKATAKGFELGMKMAGLLLQRESQKIVPVEFGILKNTANTRAEGKGYDTAAVVSYGTNYAVYVHENMEAKHKAGKEAKFLEKPLREKRDALMEVIEQHIKQQLGKK